MTRYLVRRIAMPVVVSAVGATLVIWALQVARVAPEVVTDATPAGPAARALLLPLVPAAAFALPLAAALGVLVAGRSLRRDGTFETLATCGIAPRRAARAFVVVALGAGVASAGLSAVAEPEALAALRDDVPALAAATIEGRAAPGSFVSAGAGVDLFVGARRGGSFERVLVARRDPSGSATDVFARAMTLSHRPSGDPVMLLSDGVVRHEDAGGVVTASFSSMSLPFDLGAVRGALGRVLPPGQTAAPSTILDPEALGDLDPWSRYLVVRRLAPPLETILLVVLAAALLVTGRRPGWTWGLTLGGLLATVALLRVLEPWCREGVLSPPAAVLLPHVPLLAAAIVSWLVCIREVPRPR